MSQTTLEFFFFFDLLTVVVLTWIDKVPLQPVTYWLQPQKNPFFPLIFRIGALHFGQVYPFDSATTKLCKLSFNAKSAALTTSIYAFLPVAISSKACYIARVYSISINWNFPTRASNIISALFVAKKTLPLRST